MPESNDRSGLPVVTPPASRDARPANAPSTAESAGAATPEREAATVVGVLLAAGTSSRYGAENKLLQDLDGAPIVRRAAETLLESDVDRVVVVLGYEADRVRDALAGLALEFVDNPEYERGQATSVAAGVEAVRDADAAVFALGDMPLVSADSVDALVATYRADAWTALAAACDGHRGNPVLFDATHFDALAAVDGDTGGRDVLLHGDHSALVETSDTGVLRDVDTPDEYRTIRKSGGAE